MNNKTIQQRIKEAEVRDSWLNDPPWEGYEFTESELTELLQQVAKEQDRITRHKAVDILTNHVYSWEKKGKKLTDPEFLNRLQNKLMNLDAPSPLDKEEA